MLHYMFFSACTSVSPSRRSPDVPAVHREHDRVREGVPLAVHRVQVLHAVRDVGERRPGDVGGLKPRRTPAKLKFVSFFSSYSSVTTATAATTCTAWCPPSRSPRRAPGAASSAWRGSTGNHEEKNIDQKELFLFFASFFSPTRIKVRLYTCRCSVPFFFFPPLV